MERVKSTIEPFARIRVIGVGGSGSNAIGHMIKSNLSGVEFIVVNTDLQDLGSSKSKEKVHIGKRTTRGLGTGMNAGLGKEAAEEATEELQEKLKGSDLVFVACGMGGGTGTGAAPVIAKIARELGVLTIGVITKPFSFEGRKRSELAFEGLIELSNNVDALVTIPNDKILELSNKDTTAKSGFEMSDDILLQAVKGISDLITIPGDINIDFADVKTIMSNAGVTLMGVGHSKGDTRAEQAVAEAVTSPLVEISMKGARRILFAIASSGDIKMLEIKKVADKIKENAHPDARIIFGTSTDKTLKNGTIRVTVIATAFDDQGFKRKNDVPDEKTEEKQKEKEEKLPNIKSGARIIHIDDDTPEEESPKSSKPLSSFTDIFK